MVQRILTLPWLRQQQQGDNLVDLEAIKREVDAVCKTIDRAYVSLTDRSREVAEGKKQVDEVKSEIVLLQERKVNVKENLRAEEAAAKEAKKEHTTTKTKYRKLTNTLKMDHAKALSELESELESMRARELSLLNSDKVKIVREIDLAKKERDDLRKDYIDYKSKLMKLKEGISV